MSVLSAASFLCHFQTAAFESILQIKSTLQKCVKLACSFVCLVSFCVVIIFHSAVAVLTYHCPFSARNKLFFMEEKQFVCMLLVNFQWHASLIWKTRQVVQVSCQAVTYTVMFSLWNGSPCSYSQYVKHLPGCWVGHNVFCKCPVLVCGRVCSAAVCFHHSSHNK